MAYADFTLEAAEASFGLSTQAGDLFPDLRAVSIPAWLIETINRGKRGIPLLTEKSKSEVIVLPILLAMIEQSGWAISVFSGHRLNVDPARGLVGECDYIVALGPALPRLRTPIATLVEAKNDVIENSLGQCAAQMIGAQLFNQQTGTIVPSIYGAVTSGNDWQFLRLEGTTLTIDRRMYYLNELDLILAALLLTVSQRTSAAA